ncbi:TPA: restriction endonuclease subunit S [Photobacterium damselae]
MVTDTKYPPSVKAGKPILDETPEGWARESLKKHLTLEQRKVKVIDEKEYDLVTVKRSRGGVVRRESLYGKQISVKSQFTLKQGDFLISKRQIVHGACGIVPAHLDGSIVSNEYSIFTAKDSFDLTYLRYLSETLYFQQTCFHSSIGVHIEKMIFKLDNWFKWDFNLPPLPEQRKIAQVLSTWDRGIATTEKLIDASKQQKKALMQQLLTGKKRLIDPETGKAFKGEWETEQFDKLFDIEIGGTPSRSNETYWDDKLETNNNWLSIADLKGKFISRTKERISDLGVAKSNVSLIPKGTIVMSFKLTIGRRAFLNIDTYTNEAICALLIKNKDKLDNNYLYQALEIVDFEQEIDQAVKGKTLNKAKLKRLKLLMPSVKEQQKIASVLTAADKDIELLEAKLAHLKQEKKALMQQLLTGKRRVNIAETKVATEEILEAEVA